MRNLPPYLLIALAMAPWLAAPASGAQSDRGAMRLAQKANAAAPLARPTKPAEPTAAPAPAPTPAPAPAPPPAAQNPPENKDKQEAGWISRCVSDGRQAGLDCSVEQSATLTKTGQLFAAVTIRVPPDTRQPVMMVQLPVGIFLPAGVTWQIDQQAAVPLVVQTCDLKGCYAGSQLQVETISQLKAGKRLAISFQNLNKESITVTFVLDKFAEAFGKIQ